MEVCPELAALRDATYLFKAMMAPAAEMLPGEKPWDANDARLTWRWDAKDCRLAVGGFEQSTLHCTGWAAAAAEDEDAAAAAEGAAEVEGEEGEGEEGGNYGLAEAQQSAAHAAGRAKGALAGAGRYLRQRAAAGQANLKRALGRESRPRLPPSAADASALAGVHLASEDDVLHVRHLPDFGGTLRAAEAEVLLSYLLVPYVRAPLLLGFFADSARTPCLAQHQLQQVLDAALFEPGQWQPDQTKASPSHVPAADRAAMATPAGLLFQARYLVITPTLPGAHPHVT